jgi:dihydroneopterin aldolase|tara:strand:- start:792 stop:1196 length:405 start_codon:yes stop_codon:yes gene_type:complete
MKIIKFREKKHFSYKRKVLIRDLILKISVGIHGFEKKKKQRVKFNIDINADPNLVPNDSSLDSIINYEDVIKNIKKITDKKHYPLLETLAEKIFLKLFENRRVKKVKLRIEKLDILKSTSSVGVEIEKSKFNES